MGFEIAMVATLGGAAGAALIAVLDQGLHRRPHLTPDTAAAATD